MRKARLKRIDTVSAWTAKAKSAKKWRNDKGLDVMTNPIGGRVLPEPLHAMGHESRLATLGYVSESIPEPPVNILLVKKM